MNFSNKIMILAVFISTSAVGGVICPTTVQGGKSLIITATVTNKDCLDQVIIKNTIVSLTGNATGPGGMGVIGVHGPYVAPVFSSIPAAHCTQIVHDCGSGCQFVTQSVTEGTRTFQDLRVMGAVPVAMIGSVVYATAGVIDDKNNVKIAGRCLVKVIQ